MMLRHWRYRCPIAESEAIDKAGIGMELQTQRSLQECLSIFQDAVKRRPLKLKLLPFTCSNPQLAGNNATITASFQLAEPYGAVTMLAERHGNGTMVRLATDGNIRGRVMANSLAKSIASKLQ